MASARYQPLLDGEDDSNNRIKVPPPATRLNSFTWLLTSVAGISGLLFGYDTGIISSTLLYLTPGISESPLTPFQKALITSATSFGALLGGLAFGLLAERLGRKSTIWVADVVFVLGALIQAISGSVGGMVWGRWVVGLGVGVGSGIVPMYISELAPPAYRGRLVTISVLFITFGQLISYIIGIWSGPVAWRYLVGLGALPAVSQALALIWMPESPRWLVQANERDGAREVLGRVFDGDRSEVETVMCEVEAAVKREGQYGMREKGRLLFGTEVGRRQLFIACLGQGLQQLCGFNSLMYFSPTIFAMVHFENPTATASLIALTNMIATIFAFNLIDRIGRRRILLLSLPGMALGLLLTAVFISHLPVSANPPGGGDDSESSRTVLAALISSEKTPAVPAAPPLYAGLTLASLILYVLSYGLGIGNVPWHQSELFPLETRALGSSIATATNWTGNLIVGITFLPFMVWIGTGPTFVLYAIVCAVGWGLCWRWFPEMSGVKMEEIESAE